MNNGVRKDAGRHIPGFGTSPNLLHLSLTALSRASYRIGKDNLVGLVLARVNIDLSGKAKTLPPFRNPPMYYTAGSVRADSTVSAAKNTEEVAKCYRAFAAEGIVECLLKKTQLLHAFLVAMPLRGRTT